MNHKKIALVGFRLSGGGSGRVMAHLSNFFSKQGFGVSVIILHDELGYNYSGKLYNLGKLKSKRNNIFNKIRRLLYLKKIFDKNDFDCIIDFRFRKKILQEYLIFKFVYNRKKTIYTVHSSRLDVYLLKSKFWTYKIFGKSFKVIAITNAMKKMIQECYPRLSNVSVLYNPIDEISVKLNKKEVINIDFEYVIGVGQFETYEKQFDKLILAYSKSILPQRNIHLIILGEGKLQEKLQQDAVENNVHEKVHFLGFKINPYVYMYQAKFLVLTSKYEGQPMVIIESLTCGTPVVSFDCPAGLDEIIKTNENGILVKNQNINKLIEAMNLMIEDVNLFNKCKSNAVSSVSKFELNNIGEQWLKLV